MFTDVIILAGGFGERLWPASRPDYPKQFLSLGSGFSLLQNSILRALALNISGKIIIATRKDLLEGCAVQAKELSESEKLTDSQKSKILNDLIILAEPCARHTTAPILLACHMLEKLSPDCEHSCLVLTSDHVIRPTEAFASDAEKAYKAASQNNFVCFAIPPTEAATGYGYIKAGEKILEDTFKIDRFKEKPDQKTAEEYLASGNYFWNSGMFGFTTKFMISEIEKCQKDVSDAFVPVKNGGKPELGSVNGIKYIERWNEMEKAYSVTPAIAIDNSIAEKTASAVVVRTSFEWDDVGSWDAFAKFSDGKANIAAEVSSQDNFVYSDIPVALCGVSNLIVVIKNGKALVMEKGKSSLVRDAVKAMKSE